MKAQHKSGVDLIVQIKDINICYDDLGEGEIPVIFVHGFPFDKTMWKPQVEVLIKLNRVIVYDIRGFGKSESGSENFTIGLFAQDLIDFMDALNLKTAIVCGLSMGGYILMNAVHYHPERFAGIILCDTQCIADSSEAKVGRTNAITTIKAGGLEDFAAGFVKKIFSNKTLDQNLELITQIKDVILSTSTKTITATLRALAERDEMCTKLVMLNVPTLILCGDGDVVTPPNQSELLQKNLNGSILYQIKDAGHMSNLEQSELFNERLVHFVQELSIANEKVG